LTISGRHLLRGFPDGQKGKKRKYGVAVQRERKGVCEENRNSASKNLGESPPPPRDTTEAVIKKSGYTKEKTLFKDFWERGKFSIGKRERGQEKTRKCWWRGGF